MIPDSLVASVALAVIEPDRSQFLGGSDAAAVMGLSPWLTPVELWLKKTGRAPKPTHVDPVLKKRHDRGHRLEPFIRDMTVDKLRAQGLEVELVTYNERYQDPEHPFLSAEIDFELLLTGEILIGDEIVTLEREHVNADAKSVTGFARKKWGEESTEDVPIEYAAQFMHGLMVTGRRLCLVAALRSFDDVDIYWTRRDDETISAMREREVDFWLNHVVADVPPDPVKFDDIKALFPLDNGLAVEATPEIVDAVSRLRTVKNEITRLEEEEQALTFQIGQFISPHTRLTLGDVDLMTWKGQEDRRIDQKRLAEERPDIAQEFTRTKVVRVLRFVKPKKGTR